MLFPLIRCHSLLLCAAVALACGESVLRAEKPATKDEPKPTVRTPEDAARALLNDLGVLFQPVERLRDAAARTMMANNLRQIVIAVHEYQEQNVLPAQNQAWYQSQPNSLYFQLLPQLEQGNLYKTYVSPALPPTGSRFGAHVEPVSAVLASQLALPKDGGQVIGEIEKGKAADKAGLRQHDILLKLNGKDVPCDAEAFSKLLAEIKADQAVDAEVLREGKRLPIKGLSLPEAALPPSGTNYTQGANYLLADGSVRYIPHPNLIADGTSSTIIFGEKSAPLANPEGWKVWSKGDPILATTFRNKDRFTSRHQEGTLVLTVVGTVKDGKTTVAGITVREGNEEKKYAALEKVPEEYRDKVAQMVELSAK